MGAAQLAHERLEKEYGKPHFDRPPLGNRTDRLDELIFIVLTLKTNDANFSRVFDSLKEAFPTWQSVLDAPVEALKEVIKPAGLSNQKAPRIKAILETVKKRSGDLSLGFLEALSDTDLESFLDDLPGVGLKAARCVMMYSFDRQVFPVDTHTARICRRLGWVDASVSTKRAQKLLPPLVPPSIRRSLHVNLVLHGRAACTPSKPKCGDCCLLDLCPSAGEMT